MHRIRAQVVCMYDTSDCSVPSTRLLCVLLHHNCGSDSWVITCEREKRREGKKKVDPLKEWPSIRTSEKSKHTHFMTENERQIVVLAAVAAVAKVA
jgi:hypothetical protein